MNRNTIMAMISIATGLVTTQLNAATIFAPTDGDVNFLLGDLLGAQLAIFDDADQSYTGPSLDVQISDVVGFAGPNGSGDHIATNTTSGNTLTLTGSSNFILGLSLDNGISWIADSSVSAIGANAYSVSFGNGSNLIQVDVQIVPPVPVPAAVWLFGSGLLGLVGVIRKSNRV